VSLRTRLSRLEKVRGHAGAEAVEALFRLWEEHGGDPRVSAAVDDLRRLMRAAEPRLRNCAGAASAKEVNSDSRAKYEGGKTLQISRCTCSATPRSAACRG